MSIGGNEPPKNWFSCTKNESLPQFRYEFANVSHSCGHTPYASVISAQTAIAPTMLAAQVAGSFERFGRWIHRNAIAMPIASSSEHQINRPAAVIQSGPHAKKFGMSRPSRLAMVSGTPRNLLVERD